jgi:pyruvate kinase
MGPEQVPLIQKQLIARCRLAGKPVITATQMLESMVEQPTPTRAEASDVANAVLDGTDAMMLSAESASGKYPVEAVATMARIAAAAEQALPEADYAPAPNTHPTQAITNAITAATVAAARELGARLIISLTESGYTARMVAKHRPATAILGVTPNPATYRQLALTWGVQPALIARHTHSDVMFAQARALVSQLGLAQHGETIVLTAGMPLGEPGRTNLLHIYQHGEDSGFHLPHDH